MGLVKIEDLTEGHDILIGDKWEHYKSRVCTRDYDSAVKDATKYVVFGYRTIHNGCLWSYKIIEGPPGMLITARKPLQWHIKRAKESMVNYFTDL